MGLLVKEEVDKVLALAPWDTAALGVVVELPLRVLVEVELAITPCVRDGA